MEQTDEIMKVKKQAQQKFFVETSVQDRIEIIKKWGKLIHKNKADLDFKLWGTSTAAPAIKLDAGEESLSFNAGIRVNSNDVTSFPYTVAARDYFLPCAGSGARTINLPAVSGQTGRIIIIKDSNGSAASGNITIDGNGSGESSEKIDGSDTYTMSHNKESITLICDGVGWAIAARVQP